MIQPAAAIVALIAMTLLLAAPTDPEVGEASEGNAESATDAQLLQGYIREMQASIARNWMLPDAQAGFRCVVEIEQAAGGELVSVAIADPCDATEPVRRSLLAAIRRAEPLPYAGFEPVFRRTIRLTFQRDLDP